MEEKKSKTQPINGKQQKLSYDELNKVCGELYQQNQYLQKQLQQMNMTNMFKRLDYLFKVVEVAYNGNNSYPSFSSEFVGNCISEIENSMTVEQGEQEDSEENTVKED